MDVNFIGHSSEVSYYDLELKNREGFRQALPIRAIKKIPSTSEVQPNHVNEVLIPIKKQDLDKSNDDDLEIKLSRSSTKDHINVINFFSNSDVDLKDLLRYRDVGLLAKFEQIYNDHFVSLPFSLKFREEGYMSDGIPNEIKKYFSDFISSTSYKKNIMGYIPAYSWYKDIEKLVEFYINSGIGSTTKGQGYNLIPLMVDYKGCNVDRFKLATSVLHEVKEKYLKEKVYLLYYAFSVGTPRLSKKSQKITVETKKAEKVLAKDFLLSFLGFDIIGSNYARQTNHKAKWHLPLPKEVGEFKQEDFFYHPTEDKRLQSEQKIKNLMNQNRYLNDISVKFNKDSELPLKEMQKRQQANSYIDSYNK